ncbi:MAG TPA: DUF3098 domain-containing protein [Candidatus Coprenecus stercoravium]|uniref:DUF3098 domain-containing protein n=1 Tax=Candidatus Coprenecus stercoravium TaxID=2840735 RepID=A0A9D2K9Z4_9BACT|nr:DUF3098 domain-containing protein [Candidatus Coprenecus stercoravium]
MNMDSKFAIPKENVVYLIAGLCIMILGYLLLMGGGADNPEEFNYALFSFSRMYIAPLLILAGFVVEIVVLLRRRPIRLFNRKDDKR